LCAPFAAHIDGYVVRVANEAQSSAFQLFIQCIQINIGQQWTQDSSNNRAKLSLEFSSSIEREALKVSYGEGFGGAPLRLPPATYRMTTGAGECRHESETKPSSKTVGGNHHV
jgi:hypothetical protein